MEAAIKGMEQEEADMLEEEMRVDQMDDSHDCDNYPKQIKLNSNIEEKKRKLRSNEQKHRKKAR